MTKRIGILTAGSDCPGLNAAIRAIGKAAQGSYGMKIIAFQDGFQGLVENRTVSLEGSALSGILTIGGTILGTSRVLPNQVVKDGKTEDMTDQAIQTYQKHHLDALVCIGGRETQDTGRLLAEKGLNIITLPKAIDNDIQLTDLTIGFNTAMEIAAEAIDRLHSTALSSHRIIIVEMMGRHTGWLTLGAGLSSGADVILIPEIPFNIQKIADAVIQRCNAGKNFSIVAVSERVTSQERVAFQERLRQINAQKRTGRERELVDAQLIDTENKHSDSTYHVANRLNEYTGLETRITILGYLLRGGSPSARDRFLATLMGTACVDFIQEGRFGVMVAYRDGNVVTVPLAEVDSRHKLLPEDHPWIESARRVGTVFGD